MPTCERGFTYIGVLMLLAIVALASAMTMQVAEQSGRREAEAELMAIGGEFSRAFESYYLQAPVGAARYPQRLEDLLHDPRYPGIKRHLRRLYPDPLTGRAEWGLIAAPGGGIMGVHSRAAGEPVRESASSALTLAASGVVGGASAAASSASGDAPRSYSAWQFGYAPNVITNLPPPVNGMPVR